MLQKNTLDRMTEIMEQNGLVTYLLSQYLNYNPRFLTADTVLEFAKDCNLEESDAFRILFCAACGLDTAENKEHRQIEQQYFVTGFHALDVADYTSNPYYQTIHIPQIKKGRWELRTASYAPYEPFVCGHPILTKEFREIPQIGFFKEDFSFPAVLENGVEWMTITPKR